MDYKKYETKVMTHFCLEERLIFLGSGNEGCVWTDKKNVYKIIYNSRKKLELYWSLLSLSETINALNGIHVLPKFTVSFANNFVFIFYPYEETVNFIDSNKVTINEFISLMQQFKKICWVSWDLQPKNFRVTSKGKIIIIDIGRSFIPHSNYLFGSMCRRAFVIYKLQEESLGEDDFRECLNSVNKDENFSLISKFGFLETDLKKEYAKFYQSVLQK
ncbi:hypothetical protein SPONN_2732 [uncultured Candidatus Thioglobus sp.]|nr:hypothetical protein SPONL_2187 [uncultured Candidatus Thioglobus sp.]SMN01625.1 hypothetical protein SPONN_2732 [uncultured Candidatus Thioglobus sp.]